MIIPREVLLVDGRLRIGRIDGRQRTPESGDHGARRGDPLASEVATSWEHLIGGCSGAGPITAFDPTEFMVRFACEAKEFDPARWIEHRQARRMGRFAQLVVAAAREAEADAGLEVEKESDRIAPRSRPRWAACRPSRIAAPR
jgi:hypothetical protein